MPLGRFEGISTECHDFGLCWDESVRETNAVVPRSREWTTERNRQFSESRRATPIFQRTVILPSQDISWYFTYIIL